jgi:thiamine-phosphate pyrophosphorylase
MFELATRRLYLCTPLRTDLNDFVRLAIEGGVDVVQLREKRADREDIARAAVQLREICRDGGVPFIINDDPELAAELGADGVHVGQEDVSVARCRELLGDDAIVGLSTHSELDLQSALGQAVSYLSAGPVEATPTKPGRPGTGVEYASSAARQSEWPVFVTGGVSPERIGDLVHAGISHFVVVRYLTEAIDVHLAACELRNAIDGYLSYR